MIRIHTCMTVPGCLFLGTHCCHCLIIGKFVFFLYLFKLLSMVYLLSYTNIYIPTLSGSLSPVFVIPFWSLYGHPASCHSFVVLTWCMLWPAGEALGSPFPLAFASHSARSPLFGVSISTWLALSLSGRMRSDSFGWSGLRHVGSSDSLTTDGTCIQMAHVHTALHQLTTLKAAGSIWAAVSRGSNGLRYVLPFHAIKPA